MAWLDLPRAPETSTEERSPWIGGGNQLLGRISGEDLSDLLPVFDQFTGGGGGITLICCEASDLLDLLTSSGGIISICWKAGGTPNVITAAGGTGAAHAAVVTAIAQVAVTAVAIASGHASPQRSISFG